MLSFCCQEYEGDGYASVITDDIDPNFIVALFQEIIYALCT
jgi:hypothetical protein